MTAFLQLHKRTVAFLALYLAAYILFHALRHSLPSGFVRDSFPSFLLTPFMFSIVDCVSGIRFHSFAKKLLVLTATTALAAIWFEGIVPTFYTKSRGDAGDAVAMFIGLAAYFVQHFITQQSKAETPNHALQRTAPRVTVAAISSPGTLTSSHLSS